MTKSKDKKKKKSEENTCIVYKRLILNCKEHKHCRGLNTWASLIAQLVKNLPAMRETQVQFLGWEDPLAKG